LKATKPCKNPSIAPLTLRSGSPIERWSGRGGHGDDFELGLDYVDVTRGSIAKEAHYIQPNFEALLSNVDVLVVINPSTHVSTYIRRERERTREERRETEAEMLSEEKDVSWKGLKSTHQTAEIEIDEEVRDLCL
jgi:hypothetical protein